MMRPVIKVGRDACGEWAWMMTTLSGELLGSDWGFVSYEGAMLSAARASKNFRRGYDVERAAA